MKTPRARNKIRQWFAKERREDALAQGREALMQGMRKQGLPVDKIAKGDFLQEIASELKYADLDALYVAIGEGHVSPQSIATRVIRLVQPETEEKDELIEEQPRRRSRKPRGKGVIVEGFDDLLVRLARCCTPFRAIRIADSSRAGESRFIASTAPTPKFWQPIKRAG